MARTITDARQIALRKFLEQIGNRTHHEGTTDAKPANQSELDNLLDSIDLELTQPLRLDASNPVDLTVSVGPAIVTNTENDRNRSMPHIGSLLPNDFTAGTVVFPATSGGTITITPGNNNTLTITNNTYVKVLIYMDANGDLNVLPGVENAVEADATVLPPPTNTLPIGYVTVFNNAGTIDNVAQGKIYQFGSGAAENIGAGNANDFVETLKNRLNDSIFEAVTPYIAETDQDDVALVDAGSTGSFDLVSNRFKLASIGQTLVSANLLDATFLADTKGVNQVEVIVKYDTGGLDTLATYEVSRNGGNEYQAVTMERIDSTFTYRGIHEFADEAADQTLYSQATDASDNELNATTFQAYGEKFTVSSLQVLRELDLDLTLNGAPDGALNIKIIADDTGFPSTDSADILAETGPIAISGLSAGVNVLSLPETVINAGTYHFVIETDAAYKATFVSLTKSVQFAVNTTGTTLSDFDGTTWTATGTQAAKYEIRGIDLDLRLRITGGTVDTLIEGFGVLYEENTGNLALATTVEGITKSTFAAVADNTNEFTLPFLPNADLLIVHLLGSGQSFRFGDFGLQGNTVVFPVDQFNNGGVEKVQTLVFDQLRGGAFDNSDVNAALLAANSLGSTDGSIDKSVAGQGIFLRRPDGTLREIAIDDDDQIVIYSV